MSALRKLECIADYGSAKLDIFVEVATSGGTALRAVNIVGY